MYYKVCPYCGSHLDPNEKCECREIEKQYHEQFMSMFVVDENGQLKMKDEVLENGRD